jgi:NAD-dependent oxidoreductase involved in siderophore biosynthesis
MAKAMPDPTTAAAKWAQNLGAASQAYTSGVQAVQQDPGVAAAAASDRYIAGVQANVGKFKSNVVTGLQNWQSAAVNKGAPRLASGATAAQPKMETVLGQLFPFIAQVRNTLPQRGDLEQNIARSAAFQRGMSKFVRR